MRTLEGHTAAVLRMAAAELPEHEPHLSVKLRRIADQLDAEADSLMQTGSQKDVGFV